MSIPTLLDSNPRGFSLIEVVLALGVIAFSLVAILGVFPAGFDANRRSIAETRAAEVARTVAATIDGQCGTFSAVKLYGLNPDLDLTQLKTTDIPKVLYVSYPSSPNLPQIAASDPGNAIYTVELKFDNDPSLTSSGTKLGAGKLNAVQIRVYPKDRSEFTEYLFLARNKS